MCACANALQELNTGPYRAANKLILWFMRFVHYCLKFFSIVPHCIVTKKGSSTKDAQECCICSG